MKRWQFDRRCCLIESHTVLDSISSLNLNFWSKVLTWDFSFQRIRNCSFSMWTMEFIVSRYHASLWIYFSFCFCFFLLCFDACNRCYLSKTNEKTGSIAYTHKKWNASFVSRNRINSQCGSKINYTTIYFLIQINCLHSFDAQTPNQLLLSLLSHPIECSACVCMVVTRS